MWWVRGWGSWAWLQRSAIVESSSSRGAAHVREAASLLQMTLQAQGRLEAWVPADGLGGVRQRRCAAADPAAVLGLSSSSRGCRWDPAADAPPTRPCRTGLPALRGHRRQLPVQQEAELVRAFQLLGRE